MSSENSATRKKILEATAKLLLESRGRGIRMSDIAKAAGVSRQAVYLHFESRGDLMIATVRYLDEVHGLQQRVKQFNEETTGIGRLSAFIEFWGNYIPEIYGVAKALMTARETDEAAADAWQDRMDSVRAGCRETIQALEREGVLTSGWSADEATDLFSTLMSFQNWEELTLRCGWTVEQYVSRMKTAIRSILLKPQNLL